MKMAHFNVPGKQLFLLPELSYAWLCAAKHVEEEELRRKAGGQRGEDEETKGGGC